MKREPTIIFLFTMSLLFAFYSAALMFDHVKDRNENRRLVRENTRLRTEIVDTRCPTTK